MQVIAKMLGGIVLAVVLIFGIFTVLTIQLRASVTQDELNWRMFNASLPDKPPLELSEDAPVVVDGHRVEYIGLDEEPGSTADTVRTILRVTTDKQQVRFLYLPVTRKLDGGYYGRAEIVRRQPWKEVYILHADFSKARVILH